MYLKIKKIKGIEYAYLVNQTYNKRKKNTRQKNISYLGKVLQLQRVKNLTLSSQIKVPLEEFIEQAPQREIFKALIKLELINHGFKIIGGENFVKDNLQVTGGCMRFSDKMNNSKVCFEVNQGFLTSRSLDRLCTPLSQHTDDVECANVFARRVRSEGLDPSEEVFILLFRKLRP